MNCVSGFAEEIQDFAAHRAGSANLSRSMHLCGGRLLKPLQRFSRPAVERVSVKCLLFVHVRCRAAWHSYLSLKWEPSNNGNRCPHLLRPQHRTPIDFGHNPEKIENSLEGRRWWSRLGNFVAEKL
jgi:hypothetical protein